MAIFRKIDSFDSFWSLSFSRWGLWIHACACVRASHHIWRSAHQILMIFCTKLHLDESKKMFQADFWKKFLFSRFWPKNQVFGLFLRIRTSDLSKTWSETWDNCFDSSNGSVVSRKILVLAVLGQKYISSGDIIWFWAVFGHFLPNRWWFFVNFCYLSWVYCLKMVNENFCLDKKLGPFFYPFLVQNLAIFAQKSGFWLFSWKPLIRPLRPFLVKSPLLVVTNWGFWPISSSLLMFVWQFLFLNQFYGLRRDKVSLGCDKKNWGHFWTFFLSEIWPFLLKNQVFGCFLENRLSEFHVTCDGFCEHCKTK